jgi:hypothetical protein
VLWSTKAGAFRFTCVLRLRLCDPTNERHNKRHHAELLDLDDRDPSGLRYRLLRSGRRQMASAVIDPKDDDVLTVLIGAEQMLV